MAKQPKRRLAFRTEHQRNPLSHARLTEYDFSNGVILTIKLDGRIQHLSLDARQMSFISLQQFSHRKRDEDGDTRLRFNQLTFTSFENYVDYLKLVWNEPGVGPMTRASNTTRTDEGDPYTEAHDTALALLFYAALPVWAKNKAAYEKRWPHDLDQFPFERGTDYHRQVSTADQHKAYRESKRRAA